MRYFRLLKQEQDRAPLLAELFAIDGPMVGPVAQPGDEPVARTIPLRGLVKSAQGGRDRRDVHESRWTSGSHRFPRLQEFLRQVAADEDGVLGRARIVVQSAGQQPAARAHQGEYFRLRNRYIFILKSSLGSRLRVGDEDILMNEGELWWFDNKTVHQAWNEGDGYRIHLVFDLLPRELESQVMRASRKARKASLEA